MILKSRDIQSLVEKVICRLEMVLFDELSNKQRATEGVADVFKWWISTNFESTKQWVDPESMRA